MSEGSDDKIEGTFQLSSPPVLLGYEREQLRKMSDPTNLSPRDATFITLFLTVLPTLNPPQPFEDHLASSEPSYLEKHLTTWEQDVTRLVPHRKMKTLVCDISGKTVCVTRFFRSLNPPVLVDDQPTTPEMAARFVSMIPQIPGTTLFPGLFDVWLTSDQVLRLLSGDSEDLAVLLYCYLCHLGEKAWVMLGHGVPYGPSAYVLTRHENSQRLVTYHLWDPATGHNFDVRDNFCPLQKVYCLMNDENIWANVQSEEEARHTRFDVVRRSDWLPVFGRNVGAPTGSIQPAVLEYTHTSSSSCQILQDNLEKHLRDSLMKWRKASRTVWNRYCIAILRKLLPALEYSSWKMDEHLNIDHIQEMQHLLGSHKMFGFPLNMSYTNMEAVTEAMRTTGVHYNENPGVEFALAVYIHPFPNNVHFLAVFITVTTVPLAENNYLFCFIFRVGVSVAAVDIESSAILRVDLEVNDLERQPRRGSTTIGTYWVNEDAEPRIQRRRYKLTAVHHQLQRRTVEHFQGHPTGVKVSIQTAIDQLARELEKVKAENIKLEAVKKNRSDSEPIPPLVTPFTPQYNSSPPFCKEDSLVASRQGPALSANTTPS
uniref:CEP76/DRC7 peptidase-like domain-containing protein n=1 Tax=Timema bartmani TaxID=61472 RepID=A0A7R9F327_9NEOP|nr:unnamed protein product [Timema bartmani]